MMLFKFNKVKLLCFLLFSSLLVTSCGGFKRSDVKDNPVNDADKRAKNIQEGRGVGALFGGTKNRGGSFDFATSNEMWRATLSILDFTPLSNIDYGGGIIITDWYSNDKESIKISVQFLSNDIRADGLVVKIYKKNCQPNENCQTQKTDSFLNSEIKLAILKKASLLKRGDQKKASEEKGEYTIVPTQ
tara:strand:- start:279 stop:842 length:564 start_codon:yes stop_codon:yes gene_type:complete